MGNPHAIFWVDDVDAYDLARIGPLLENHPIFPERANISLAQVVSRTHLVVRTWERGAGLAVWPAQAAPARSAAAPISTAPSTAISRLNWCARSPPIPAGWNWAARSAT